MDCSHDIRLVKPSNMAYRMFCGRYSSLDKKRRPRRDPLQREYTLTLQLFEKAVQRLLATYFVADEHRILRFVRRFDSNRERVEYRELDFVVARSGAPHIFMEMKFRETYRPHTNTGQLRKGLNIASDRWGALKGVWLNVHMGPVFGVAVDDPIEYSTFSDVKDCMKTWLAEDGVSVFWLSGEEVMAEAIDIGLLPTDFVGELRMAREAAMNPLSTIPKESADDRVCLGDLFPLAA